jgi:hypothetical protein
MTTDSLWVFGVSTAVSTAVAIFDHWLASNKKMAANSTWQFISRVVHGAARAADVAPCGIEQHIIEGVAKVGEHAAEEAIDGR